MTHTPKCAWMTSRFNRFKSRNYWDTPWSNSERVSRQTRGQNWHIVLKRLRAMWLKILPKFQNITELLITWCKPCKLTANKQGPWFSGIWRNKTSKSQHDSWHKFAARRQVGGLFFSVGQKSVYLWARTQKGGVWSREKNRLPAV